MDTVVFLLLLLGNGGCATVDQSDGASLVVLDGRPLLVNDEFHEGTTLCADGRRPKRRPQFHPRATLPRSSSLDELRR